MADGGQRSIAKVRTFNGDVSRARSTGSTTASTPTVPPHSPASTVTPPATPVPPPPHGARELPVPQPRYAEVVPPTPPQNTAAPTPLGAKPVLVDAAAISNALSDFKDAPASTLAAKNFDAIDDALTNEGTIVSDKRRKRFRLLPAIGTAVTDWASDTKANLTKKEVGATVTSAESRIDTLRAAAASSHQVPQDDHSTVVKRLTEVPRTPVSTTANIKAPSTVAAPTWKHVADNEVAAPEPVAPEPVRRTQIPVTSLAQEPTLPTTPPPTPPPVPSPSPVVPVAPAPIAPPVPATPVRRLVPPELQYQTPPPPPPVAPELYKVPQPTVVFATPASTVTGPSRRTVTIMFTLVVLGASLLGVGATTLWYIGTNAPVEKPSVTTVPTLISTDIQVPIPIAPDRATTLTALLDATANTVDTQQLYLTTVDESATVRPAEASEIFTALALRVPGNFSRSVRVVSFGSYAGTHPFIVMRSTDFSTAFAGMLAWETTMSADLVPLFGTAVNESFDETARTATQVRTAFFRDTIMANVSTRVLVDASNTERIVYGFVKPNLILIAPNEATFTAIAPQLIEVP